MTLKESGEDCFKVFLENGNVNHIGSQNAAISMWYVKWGKDLMTGRAAFFTASVAKLAEPVTALQLSVIWKILSFQK